MNYRAFDNDLAVGKKDEPSIPSSSYGRFHAVVIGCQNYRHLTKLETPKADAKAVADVLEQQYGFTVELLLDKTRDEIMLALSGLRKTMTSEDDSLLIYYAGHGYLDKMTDTGYWQPVDAEKDNPVYWIPTDDITRQLKALQIKHILVVADSCYSGSLLRDSGTKLPSGVSQDEWLKRMFQRRSRTALTSGGEEPVADGGGSGHSVFAWVFLEVLRGNREILDGDSLFNRIKRPVALNADQTPHYGDIKKAGQDVEQGAFLFVPKELQEGGIPEQPERKADLSFLQRSGGNSAATLPEKPRQNADLQKGRTIGQYIDYGDGTITDTKSGLMWKRCSEGLSGVNCEEGKAEEYKWDDAVQRFKNVKYAGYSDWRLPTIDELKTLIYCSKGKHKKYNWCNEGSEHPAINQQAFSNIQGADTWSGSPFTDIAEIPNEAWYVNFSGGGFYICQRNQNFAVRLVRGGQ